MPTPRILLGAGVLGVLLLMLLINVMAGPNADLLTLENPTDAQIREMTGLMSADDMKLRGRAKQKLVDLGDRSLEPLKAYAKHGAGQAHVALELLLLLQPDAMFQAVAELIEHPDPEVRLIAANAIHPLRDRPDTIELWVRALGDEDTEIRMDVANRLRETPVEHRVIAVAGLRTLQRDPNVDVRRQAVETLQSLTRIDYSTQFNLESN